MLINNSFLKKLWLYRYESGAGLIIAGAIILRLILLAFHWPTTNSDEAMNNLAALHIESKGEHPIFFYGQAYLGNFEGYLGSLLFRVAGPSVMGMRLEMLVLTTLFLLCLYMLTKKLYSRGLALIVLICLFFGSQWTLVDQMQAFGYPELPLFTALLCLIACTVALSFYRLSAFKRCLLYALWGLVAGLALWVQLLIAPYILVSGLLVLVTCWREFFKRAIWCILPALLLGAAPLIYYNLTAPSGQDTLHVFLAVSQMGYDPQHGFLFRMELGILITLPVASGAVPFCTLNNLHPLGCVALQGSWGLGYLALALLGLTLAGTALWKLSRFNPSPERHQQISLQLGRLMLLCGCLLSLFFLIQGNALNISATTSWRYLICTWISLPAILWPLWTCDQWFPVLWQRGLALTLKWGFLALIALVLAHSTVIVFQQSVPAAQERQQQMANLQQTLEQQHITRFYSTYWTCGWIIFASHERLICGNTSNNLSHDLDRYPLYRAIVEQDPHPGFVYPTGAAQITTLNRLLAQSRVTYKRFTIPGYVIYKMEGRIPALNL